MTLQKEDEKHCSVFKPNLAKFGEHFILDLPDRVANTSFLSVQCRSQIKQLKKITKAEEIKRITLEYCKNSLKNRLPKCGFERDLQSKKDVHEMRMMSRNPEYENELTHHKFMKSVAELKSKRGNKYDFIIKGGSALKEALFKLYKTVWDSEKLPPEWRKTTIIQLQKSNGDPSEFDLKRNLHIKSDTYKHFGSLVMNEIKSDLFNRMTKYQLGTKPGHRAQEHIYVLKSIINFSLWCDTGVIFTLYDISKFFDRENIYDVMGEAFQSGVRGKTYRLLFEMNKETTIKVKTPLGETEEAETGAHLGQGTVEGAILL